MGVKARLIDYTTQKKLEMATIGPDMESVHTKKINFLRPIDKIDILSDTQGVCDVILYDNTTQSSLSLSNATDKCKPKLSGIESISMTVPQEVPLVGFHGRVNEFGLVSLGLIMLDTISSKCLHSSSSFDMSLIQGNTAQEQADFAENSITKEEKERAKVLEAILRYDIMREAAVNKEELLQKIKDLVLGKEASDEGKKGSSIQYHFNGQTVSNFADLVNLQKEKA